jgi:hypothetical protein
MVIPSPIEEHLGQVWDPRQHQEEIEESNRVLRQFIEDMDAGRVPDATMGHIRTAAASLGEFAGYPSEACNMESFLDSAEASSSYRTTVSILKVFVDEMNTLILARMNHSKLAASEAPNSVSGNTTSRHTSISDDDMPF